MFNIKWPVTAYNNKICCESKEITLPKKKKIHIYQEGTQFYLFIYIYIYIFFFFSFFLWKHFSSPCSGESMMNRLLTTMVRCRMSRVNFGIFCLLPICFNPFQCLHHFFHGRPVFRL